MIFLCLIWLICLHGAYGVGTALLLTALHVLLND